GVRLTKTKPNYYYRPISKKASTQPNNKGNDVSDLQEINIVSLQNSFDALMAKGKIFEVNNETWKVSNDVRSIMDDSNSEEVENLFVEDNGKPMDGLLMMHGRRWRLLPRRLSGKLIFGRVKKGTLLKEK
ncbi:hypothetical protein Tco_0034568, partial [Tanacetum coccineum]